jgi:bifunctional non-homologous end joining protein LigD
MEERLPELAALPQGLGLDGELVGLGDDGLPSFPRLSARVLRGRDGIAVTFVVFDVLARDGRSTLEFAYSERRRILESLNLHGPAWCTAEVFDDGPALFAAVVAQGLEGIVAKRSSGAYRPGERDWLKIKNRKYWRFGQELELAQSRRRVRPII